MIKYADVARVQPERDLVRVLIADDAEAAAYVIADYLSALQYQCTTVHDGGEALEFLLTQPYDVALLDQNMPGLTGEQIIHLLKEAREHNPKFILCSADKAIGRLNTNDPLSPDACVQSPISLPVLAQKLDQILTKGKPSLSTSTPAADPGNQEAVMDLNRYLRTSERARRVFLSETETTLVTLRTAANDDDVQFYLDLLHKLKSGAGHFGALALYDLLVQIEACGASYLSADAMVRCLKEIETLFEKTKGIVTLVEHY